MKYEEIMTKLNKKNVSKLKLIITDGTEIIVSKNDILKKDDKELIIKMNTGERTVHFDEIKYATIVPKNQIFSLKRQGQRNRHG